MGDEGVLVAGGFLIIILDSVQYGGAVLVEGLLEQSKFGFGAFDLEVVGYVDGGEVGDMALVRGIYRKRGNAECCICGLGQDGFGGAAWHEKDIV